MADPRVLLVDDEVDFIEALSARMEARGLVVETASNGEEAVQKVRDRRFDAIVLDLAMPGMDGIETLRALRELQPEVQVILLTGHATLQKGVEAMKLGAMDFLEKPVDINVLMEKIKQAKSTTDELTEKRTEQIVQDILKTKGW
jgi:DNA-binding NtrC family response regulator